MMSMAKWHFTRTSLWLDDTGMAWNQRQTRVLYCNDCFCDMEYKYCATMNISSFLIKTIMRKRKSEQHHVKIRRNNNIFVWTRCCLVGWFQILRHRFRMVNSHNFYYHQISYIRRTSVGNNIVDHSNIVGAALSALLQLHLHSRFNTWLQWIWQMELHDETRIT